MSASRTCKICKGSGIFRHADTDLAAVCPCFQPESFDALHAIYHERDFRVRVNDPVIHFANRILAKSVGGTLRNGRTDCIACLAGYDPSHLQPNDEDHRR